MRFKRFDLNLLLALDVLLKEQSVSHAARQLNLSQPAMSAALGRLREYFNDPILVPYGKKMLPTAHAQGLAPVVAKLLADIDALISASTVFDPATSQRTFRVCASDYVTTVFLGPLLAKLANEAPGVRIQISAPDDAALGKLEQGETDLLLVPESFTSKDHPSKLLFEERHVVVGCKNNPLFRRPLTAEAFFEAPHIAVTLSHQQTFAEEQLRALGPRRIEIVAPSFLAVPWMLPNTRRLAVMHERLARTMVKQLPLAIAPLPFRFPLMREMAQYHTTRAADGGVQWLLGRMLEYAAMQEASAA
ncbi:MAG: LysR family transcriptional regulator [Gammaproteobacteria bacterium]|nr:LysR family transcriptional regulator [Gammaproteobacteria bacterium]